MLQLGMMALLNLKTAARRFLRNERGEVNVVAIVVLIAVAVVLALLFKDQIARLIRDMIDGISGKAATALDDA